MRADELIAEVERILRGIDKTGTEYVDGWWETSKGAEFGAQKLREIRELIERSIK